MASNKTSNQTSENQDDNQWPRFLIMEAAKKNIALNLNAFMLKKAIDGMANADIYWSRNKTAMQKSLEDNQATGLLTCTSFTTQNSEFFKICH